MISGFFLLLLEENEGDEHLQVVQDSHQQEAAEGEGHEENLKGSRRRVEDRRDRRPKGEERRPKQLSNCTIYHTIAVK